MANEEMTHSEDLAGHGEPWADWETGLVAWSIGIGIVSLIVLGGLINAFILD